MSIMVTYDLDRMWSEVKSTALHNGFSDFLVDINGEGFYLPNTTLVYLGSDRSIAIEKFKQVVRHIDPRIKMRVAAFDWTRAELFDSTVP